MIFAACWTFMAVGIWQTRSTEVFFPSLWPAWFLATAVVTVLAVIDPTREPIVKVAGAMSVIAATGRVGAIWVNLASGHEVYVSSNWRLLVATGAYVMLAILMAGFWLHEVAPWAAGERRKRA